MLPHFIGNFVCRKNENKFSKVKYLRDIHWYFWWYTVAALEMECWYIQSMLNFIQSKSIRKDLTHSLNFVPISNECEKKNQKKKKHLYVDSSTQHTIRSTIYDAVNGYIVFLDRFHFASQNAYFPFPIFFSVFAQSIFSFLHCSMQTFSFCRKCVSCMSLCLFWMLFTQSICTASSEKKNKINQNRVIRHLLLQFRTLSMSPHGTHDCHQWFMKSNVVSGCVVRMNEFINVRVLCSLFIAVFTYYSYMQHSTHNARKKKQTKKKKSNVK